MGLDMYMSARKYVRRHNWDRVDDEVTKEINPLFTKFVDAIDANDVVEPDGFSGISVDIPFAYWRKANAIHGWIVDNCAEGVDECQRIYLSPPHIEQLLGVCKEVLENKDAASELLPPSSGFFFGSQATDEWYFEDIKYTVEVLEKAIKIIKDENQEYDFYYQASW